MRRLRWTIAITLILLLTVAFVSERKHDDMAALRPYIFFETTRYYPSQLIAIAYRDPHAPALSIRKIELKGITETQLVKFLQGYASREDGWRQSTRTQRSPLQFAERRGSVYEFVGAFDTRLPIPQEKDRLYEVTIFKPLSRFDVWLLRIENIGKDPFAHSMPTG